MSKLKPVKDRQYNVLYQCRSELEALDEYRAKTYSDVMDTDTLRWFLLTPNILIREINPEYSKCYY